MTQTITLKDGTVLSVIAVYSTRDLIQGAYREAFEIRIPIEGVTYDSLSALAAPEKLSELTLTEKDSETGEITASYTHCNFTIVTYHGHGNENSVRGRDKVLLSIRRAEIRRGACS